METMRNAIIPLLAGALASAVACTYLWDVGPNGGAGDAGPDSPAEGGPEGCVPTCGARQCGGDDGCGRGCGECSGTDQCSASGACRACAPTGWRTGIPAILDGTLWRDPQTSMVWVGGTRRGLDGGLSESAITWLDGCTGDRPGEVTSPPDDAGRPLPPIFGLTGRPGGGAFYMRGPDNGLTFGRFDTLTSKVTAIAPVGRQGSGSFDIAGSANGAWIAGWLTGDAGGPKAHAIFGNARGEVCAKALPYAEGGTGRAVAVDGKDVYVATVLAAGTRIGISHLDDTACAAGCGSCAVLSESWPESPTARPLLVFAATVVGTTLFIAGTESLSADGGLGGNWQGLLLQIDVNTRQWGPVLRLDATTRGDFFTALRAYAGRLYVGESGDFDNVSYTSARGRVLVYDLPITSTSNPTTTIDPKAHKVTSIHVDASGLYLACATGSGVGGGDARLLDTVVMRCSPTACP